MKKVKNFWFYYKKHLLIGLAVLLVLAYFGIQRISTPIPDYHIGLVREIPCTQEELEALKLRFTAAGQDVNGDGQVLVAIHTYYIDLSNDTANVSEETVQTVSALDADLIGGVSGIFLLDDVVAFQAATNGILESVIPDFDQDLFLALRKDADSIYKTLLQRLC